MDVVPIHSLDDPRVGAYRNLKDRELAGEGGRFIAEGEFLVRRLIDSALQVESVLVATRRADAVAPLVPDGVPVYVAEESVMQAIVGFPFHRGVLGIGLRPPNPALGGLLPPPDASATPVTLVVCPDITILENLGAIVRAAAGFGADGLLLGPRCADPFFRRCVRVSMGAVFNLPIRTADDLRADLAALRERWDIEPVATVCAGDAEPLAAAARPHRLALLLGEEAHGLNAGLLDACDRRVTIPMHPGTDSLNVAAAAAVCLYHFTMVAPPAGGRA